MSREVKYCYEDEDADHVARNMGELQVRRLPVVDRDKRLVGILSLGRPRDPGRRPRRRRRRSSGISQPGGQHSQRAA